MMSIKIYMMYIVNITYYLYLIIQIQIQIQYKSKKIMQHKISQLASTCLQKIKAYPKTAAALSLALLAALVIRRQQHRIIYIPQMEGMPKSPAQNNRPYRNPLEYKLPNSKNIQIKSGDGTILRGWYIARYNQQNQEGMHQQKQQQEQPQTQTRHKRNQNILKRKLILYFHENAGNIGYRLPLISKLVHYTNSDVMIVAYRGYSDSEGRPSQKGIKQDAIAILDRAIQQAQSRDLGLVVFGRSLGGAAAIYSCAQLRNKSEIKGLILQNTFTSISDIATDMVNHVRFLIRFMLFFLLSNTWQSDKLISKIDVPTLFIKSAKDELIPIYQMHRLEKLSASTKKYSYVVEHGNHNQTWNIQPNVYFQKVNQFFAKL